MPVNVTLITPDLNVRYIAQEGYRIKIERDGRLAGRIYFGRGGIRWCRGKTSFANGVDISWAELFELIAENQG